jgi:two-component system KDP operon response regulator KdpE
MALTEEITADAPGAGVCLLFLVVADDRRVERLLKGVLAEQGYRVVCARTGSEALALAASHGPDFVLLDLGLPDIDGAEVMRRLREWLEAPILVLSARASEREKIAILDDGANDFITKPFGTGELLARIRVWLRHAEKARARAAPVLHIGDLRVDLNRRLAFLGGGELRLTATEYKLLALLARNADKVMTHPQLLRAVWGTQRAGETQYLRVYMGRLRQKIEANPASPRYLVTEPGVGYRMRTADANGGESGGNAGR